MGGRTERLSISGVALVFVAAAFFYGRHVGNATCSEIEQILRRQQKERMESIDSVLAARTQTISLYQDSLTEQEKVTTYIRRKMEKQQRLLENSEVVTDPHELERSIKNTLNAH